MNESLTSELADLAGQVRGVDLRQRVLAGSRRRRARRHTLAGIVALALIVGGVLAVWSVKDEALPLPAVVRSSWR